MNKFRIVFQLILTLFLSGIYASEIFAQQETIVFDTQSGNYIITYLGWDDETHREVWRQTIFIPGNKIDPVLKSKFKIREKADSISYHYKLKNGATSKQAIDLLIMSVTNINAASQAAPEGWNGSVVPNYDSVGFRVSWSYKTGAGLAPKDAQSGFGFESNNLPGIGMVQIEGDVPSLGYVDEGPDEEFAKQVHDLERNNRGVSRFGAIPKIPVPAPFDVATILSSLQQHVNQDLVAMKLIDSAFASQLDRLFQTAIAAAKGGNTVALKGDIKDLRRMLKREHANVDKEDEDWDKDNNGKDKEKDKSRQIDKLAAKVLDFDLKYVQKRVED